MQGGAGDIEDVIVSGELSPYAELIAIAVLVLGFVVARLMSLALGSLLAALDRRAARIATTETSVVSPGLIRLSRALVFWVFLILAVSVSLRLLGVGGIATSLNAVIAFVPQVLIGFAIVVAGHLLGLVARHLLSQLSDDLSADSIGPRLLHGAIVTVAIVMGLQHIAIDISFVTQLLLILVAVLAGGLMLTFALGARQHVANLLARNELAQLAVGERIRVGELEGAVVDIYSTGVNIATDEGIASIPAARLAEVGVLHKAESDDDG